MELPLINKVQSHLLAEFANRGIIDPKQLALQHPELVVAFSALLHRPSTLKVSTIVKFMDYLEIKEINIDKLTIYEI